MQKLKILKKMEYKYFYNRIWGVSYNPTTKTILAGYAMDAQSFIPTFMITETDEDDVDIAIIMCAELNSCFGLTITTFEKLIQEYLLRLG